MIKGHIRSDACESQASVMPEAIISGDIPYNFHELTAF